MKIDKDMKKQITILTVIAIVMIIITLIMNGKMTKEDYIKENMTENVIKDETQTIDGMNEQQVDNLKGLMETEKYEEYKNYFNSSNSNENTVIENIIDAEDLIKQGENIDYLTNEEQKELDQELEEALRLYGYDSTEGQNN